jgi:hypothetical protein
VDSSGDNQPAMAAAAMAVSGARPGAAAGYGTQPGAAAARPSPRQLANLRRTTLGGLVMLILEFALGTGVSLYVTLPAGDRGSGVAAAIGRALADGPAAVAAHAAIGLLLIVAGIGALIRAVAGRQVPVIVLSAIALLAILGAAASGARFVGTAQNGASLGMALATAVAMLCYAVSLFVLGERAAGSSGAS